MFFLMKDHEKPGCFNFSASGLQCQACSLTNQGGSCWAQPPRDLLTEKFRFCIFAPSFCSKWACWWNLDEVCSYLHHRHDCQPESHESCWTIPHVVGALDHFLYSFPIFVGMMIQSDELIFFRGVETNHQPVMCVDFRRHWRQKTRPFNRKTTGTQGTRRATAGGCQCTVLGAWDVGGYPSDLESHGKPRIEILHHLEPYK